MKVAIIGSGVVGKATGLGLREKGHLPVFFDINSLATENVRKDGFLVADSVEDAVRTSDVVMLCVPTPTVDGRTSLQHIHEASTKIGAGLERVESYKVVVVRSTVLPGCTRNDVLPTIEKVSGKRAGLEFGVCVNPEFFRQESALRDFLSPDRIVVGQLDTLSGDVLEKLYNSFHKPIVRCSLEEAELAKHVCNAFLATKISYFNEVFRICRKIGANPEVVSLAASLDRRIGEYGISGGRAFGGPCLPKDLEAFIGFVRSLGDNPKILDAAIQVNEEAKRTQTIVEVAPKIREVLTSNG